MTNKAIPIPDALIRIILEEDKQKLRRFAMGITKVPKKIKVPKEYREEVKRR